MISEKKEKLETKGWKIVSASDSPGLSAEEENIIELRLALSRAIKSQRLKVGLTQAAAAALLRSSQSRIAKIEAGDKSVSLDLMLKSLIRLGIKADELPQILTESLKN